VNDYLETPTDYELASAVQLQYLHHLFTGEALRFYRSFVVGATDSFTTALAMMQAEYNIATRQHRIRQYLHGLRLFDIIKEKSLSVSAALEYLREEITKLSPHDPPSHHGEEHKVVYLQKAVVGAMCAKNPLSSA
jgi:hypothetical protein